MEAAHKAGLVGVRRVLDSTPLYDAVATMDTVTLVRSAVRAVLKAAGSDLDRAVKTTVFLKSMDSFVAMNEVYGRPEYFGSNPPARSTVEVARLPRDVLVEIEVLALV